MKIPYVIDNQANLLADILNGLLGEQHGRSMDIATAYFTVGGFGLIKDGLKDLGNLRILLGAEPTTGEQIGLKPDTGAIKGLLRKDLEDSPFNEETLRLVEDLISYLRQDKVLVRLHDKGFLHAKCWLFYGDERGGNKLLFERMSPILAIVGSSNFTYPGLTSNRELNLTHKVLLDPEEAKDELAARSVSWLSESKPSKQITNENRQLIKSEVGARAIIDLVDWYDKQWDDARDFKQELIDILNASKFGQQEYTPYQVYMKALYEYFRDDLGDEPALPMRSVIELAEFQEHAVKKARKIMAQYDGVMIADSVGLGKTWIGKKLLEDFAYHMRQKALIVCPASLREMWTKELTEASIAHQILSQEALGREEFDPKPYGDADIILIDESHNFRNKNAQRYMAIETILGMNNKRGRDGGRKKIILLTATPINNDLIDLYNQLNLITMGDRSYFSSAGIGDVYKYILQARREAPNGDGVHALFNLLEEIVIRRTRPFIRKAYPEATINGEKITFPTRKLKTIQYNLEATYSGIYEDVVKGVESLKLAPYNLETYKKVKDEVDDFEKGREQALVGIFKSRYLKRFESSIDAFRISIRRAMSFIKTFESYLLDGKLIRSGDFQKALRYVEREDEEDDATPSSFADEIDDKEEAKHILENMEEVDTKKYNLRKVHDDLQHDIEVLSKIWDRVKNIGPKEDAKLERLKELLSGDLKGNKVLVFTYYKDTARYLFKNLGHHDNPEAVKFKESINANIRKMDSDASPKDRVRIIKEFAPIANGEAALKGTDKEIDILISTDVLSEGQNLQDCGYMLNYDLHWNPTRMVQRAGRIDRIGTKFDTLWIFNMFPDEGLEKLLGLVESLNRKISVIDRPGLLDASVLGETVNPRNFNTLRKIKDEDGSVIEEEEKTADLVSNEFLLQQLQGLLDTGGQEMLDSLPDGIHSGLAKPGAKGAFFYFKATPSKGENLHFWKYYDLKDERIIDNRYILANLIACSKDEPRIVDQTILDSIFNLQEKIVEDILNTHQKQQALESAPRSVEAVQQTVATAIQEYINHPDVNRSQAIEIIKYLSEPMLNVQIKRLRKLNSQFQGDADIKELLKAIEAMQEDARGALSEGSAPNSKASSVQISREDLRLICFDIISGG